jgi:hypothetical protein
LHASKNLANLTMLSNKNKELNFGVWLQHKKGGGDVYPETAGITPVAFIS